MSYRRARSEAATESYAIWYEKGRRDERQRIAALEAAAQAILPAAMAGIHFARAGKDGGAVLAYGAAYDALVALLKEDA